ncbi:GD15910 [Drosophila simulans]|uniref:GD15910 n=1 Tax=Drosophila simulans TaxID=7240 RepID=B4R412_DROSI|nr:GD15910 [Drosophila simulans]
MAPNRKDGTKNITEKQEAKMLAEAGGKSASDSDASDTEWQLVQFVDDPNVLRVAIIACPVETPQEDVEQFFLTVFRRSNIGIVIIDYDMARRLSTMMQRCQQLLPVLSRCPTNPH